MVWVKFRFAGGIKSPCLTPFPLAESFTITKNGVLLLDNKGSVVEFYKAPRVAEVMDTTARFVQDELVKGSLTYHMWRQTESWDALGRNTL